MENIQFAVWGLTGGLILEMLEFCKLIKANEWEFPSKYKKPAYILAMIFRVIIGAPIAYLLMEEGTVDSNFKAFIVGVGAPSILEKFTKMANDVADSDSIDKN